VLPTLLRINPCQLPESVTLSPLQEDAISQALPVPSPVKALKTGTGAIGWRFEAGGSNAQGAQHSGTDATVPGNAQNQPSCDKPKVQPIRQLSTKIATPVGRVLTSRGGCTSAIDMLPTCQSESKSTASIHHFRPMFSEREQVVMSRGGYTSTIDMWSAGCIFGELLQRVTYVGSAATPQLQVAPLFAIHGMPKTPASGWVCSCVMALSINRTKDKRGGSALLLVLAGAQRGFKAWAIQIAAQNTLTQGPSERLRQPCKLPSAPRAVLVCPQLVAGLIVGACYWLLNVAVPFTCGTLQQRHAQPYAQGPSRFRSNCIARKVLRRRGQPHHVQRAGGAVQRHRDSVLLNNCILTWCRITVGTSLRRHGQRHHPQRAGGSV